LKRPAPPPPRPDPPFSLRNHLFIGKRRCQFCFSFRPIFGFVFPKFFWASTCSLFFFFFSLPFRPPSGGRYLFFFFLSRGLRLALESRLLFCSGLRGRGPGFLQEWRGDWFFRGEIMGFPWKVEILAPGFPFDRGLPRFPFFLFFFSSFSVDRLCCFFPLPFDQGTPFQGRRSLPSLFPDFLVGFPLISFFFPVLSKWGENTQAGDATPPPWTAFLSCRPQRSEIVLSSPPMLSGGISCREQPFFSFSVPQTRLPLARRFPFCPDLFPEGGSFFGPVFFFSSIVDPCSLGGFSEKMLFFFLVAHTGSPHVGLFFFPPLFLVLASFLGEEFFSPPRPLFPPQFAFPPRPKGYTPSPTSEQRRVPIFSGIFSPPFWVREGTFFSFSHLYSTSFFWPFLPWAG